MNFFEGTKGHDHVKAESRQDAVEARLARERVEMVSLFETVDLAKSAGVNGGSEGLDSAEYQLAELLTAEVMRRFFDGKTGGVQVRQIWETEGNFNLPGHRGNQSYDPARDFYDLMGIEMVMPPAQKGGHETSHYLCIPPGLIKPEIADAWKANAQMEPKRSHERIHNPDAVAPFQARYKGLGQVGKNALLRNGLRFLSPPHERYVAALQTLDAQVVQPIVK